MTEKTQIRRNSSPPVKFTATPTGRLQRKCTCDGSAESKCADCKRKKLQRHAISGAAPACAPPIVHQVLRSSGEPMDGATRGFFESRFDHDFSKVRVHSD